LDISVAETRRKIKRAEIPAIRLGQRTIGVPAKWLDTLASTHAAS
jgi:hypothetical protein